MNRLVLVAATAALSLGACATNVQTAATASVAPHVELNVGAPIAAPATPAPVVVR